MRYVEHLPNPVRAFVRALKFAGRSNLRLLGAYHPRSCTVCGHTGRFFSYGFPLAADVVCPACLSYERHRALAIYALQQSLFRDKDVLHFAPEPGIKAFVRGQSPRSYKTCDLYKRDVDIRMDIQSTDMPDEAFDVIICLHVLEHVPDDRKAMSELNRMLSS
jgi:hypothetical protein